MSATSIARKHFEAALAEAKGEDIPAEIIARYMLSEVVRAFLAVRSVADVKAELIGAAENADPDTDYAFMRP